jgi:hypothetical protein
VQKNDHRAKFIVEIAQAPAKYRQYIPLKIGVACPCVVWANSTSQKGRNSRRHQNVAGIDSQQADFLITKLDDLGLC